MTEESEDEEQNHTSTINSIIDPPKMCNDLRHRLEDLITTADVDFEVMHLGILSHSSYRQLRPFKTNFVSVEKGDFGAAFVCEGEGDLFTNACDGNLAIDIGDGLDVILR